MMDFAVLHKTAKAVPKGRNYYTRERAPHGLRHHILKPADRATKGEVVLLLCVWEEGVGEDWC